MQRVALAAPRSGCLDHYSDLARAQFMRAQGPVIVTFLEAPLFRLLDILWQNSPDKPPLTQDTA